MFDISSWLQSIVSRRINHDHNPIKDHHASPDTDELLRTEETNRKFLGTYREENNRALLSDMEDASFLRSEKEIPKTILGTGKEQDGADKDPSTNSDAEPEQCFPSSANSDSHETPPPSSLSTPVASDIEEFMREIDYVLKTHGILVVSESRLNAELNSASPQQLKRIHSSLKQVLVFKGNDLKNIGRIS